MNGLISSPHIRGGAGVTQVMLQVIYALLPAIAAHLWLFGWGVLINMAVALTVALLAEAALLAARRQPLEVLRDGSAAVTAVLLAFALPPLAPWWLPAIGTAFAIVVAKQLYGGLGYNPFNPAMVGYVVLLISFPLEMTTWLAPGSLREGLGLLASLTYSFTGQLPAGLTVDALTMATPLDAVKTELGLGQTVETIRAANSVFGVVGGRGWEVVNALVLLGGLYLIARRVITWHAPAGMLGAVTLMALIFHLANPERFADPLFHLATGGVVFGAFFIATDPVSGATSPRGRLLFGAGVGVFAYIIRNWGGYPEGVAFSVLLMNMAAPTIDYYTQPRVFGQSREG